MKFSTRQIPIRVAVLWHDTVTTELLARKAVHIGEDLRCDLVLPDVAGIGAKHVAFEPDNDGGWWFRPTAEMAGTLERGGQPETLDALRPVALSEGDWGQIDLGAVSLFFRVGSEAVVLPGGATLATVSTPLLGSLTGALGLHLAILIGAFLLYDQDPELTYLPQDHREVVVTTEAPAKPLPDAEMDVESMTEDIAKAPPGKESSFGTVKEAETPKLQQRDGTLVERIKKSAVISALGRGPIRDVMRDTQGLINKLDQAMVGGDGPVVEAGGGGFGLTGIKGGGGGGAGPGGRIGGNRRLGNLTGHGRPTKSRLKKKTERRVTVTPQRPTIGGAFCKPSDIQRVVSARANGVKFCYEKALGANPELSGQLSLSWRILPDGSVAKVRVEKSTLGNKAVGNCVARVIKRWKFPKPDGGQCAVRYPFVFNSGL
ncbi:MAG: TonB family protein [Bradymonadia bacterium]|jgi:TonB family protein